MRKFSVTKILPYFWLLFLLGTLLISAQTAYRKSLNTEEYPYACDSFGYLRMAKEIRQAASRRDAPQFKLETEQTRQLIEFMKSKNVPLPLWEEVVAPHAHHYFAESDSVGVQYPPGTGLTLAIFPEGRAIYDLNRVVIVILVLTGVLALFAAAWKKAWITAGLAVLGVQVGLSILARIGAVSFSVNATLVPILLSMILVLLALALRTADRGRLAWLAALGAGLMLGFAVMVRLPTVLIVPGLVLLLWPRSQPFKLRNLALPLTLGVLLIGILPVFWHQHEIAGAWYLPTYGRMDATLPTLARIKHHFSYYFGEGFAAEDNWALVYALIGFAGAFVLLRSFRDSATKNRLDLSYERLALAALLVWLLPTVFFLSHATHGLHYAMATTFATVTLIGLGSLAIEATTMPGSKVSGKSRLRWAAGLALIIFSAAGSFHHAWRDRTTNPAPTQPRAHVEDPLPAELSDSRSWVWADLLTGTLWYYHNKPAYKIQFTDAETRGMIFKFVSDRGDQQYLIEDSERMTTYMNEIIKLGGRLESKGQVNGSPYYLIHWPAGGPLVARNQG